jgi:hypothetical protein
MSPPGSTLLLDEYLESGDARLLSELLACGSESKLASLVERLATDTRPAIRQVVLGYIDDGCDRPAHRALVKGLFKRAETAGDTERMAHFLVAFDRLRRRSLKTVKGWDYVRREEHEYSVLREATGVPRFDPQRLRFVPPALRPRVSDLPVHRVHVRPGTFEAGTRFSLATRLYLSRRALRYFRFLAFRDPARYRTAAVLALSLYQDEHLCDSVRLLDAWGFLNLVYHGSPVLMRTSRGAHVLAGRTLADLSPSPLRPELWQAPEAFEPLYGLLRAPARPVRMAALHLLRAHHLPALRALGLEPVRLLLTSPHDELQDLGAELLGSMAGLDNLPIRAWLELLALQHAGAVQTVCELVSRHVTPDRLTLEQCIDLALARTAPVAELGLRWAQGKPVRSEDDLVQLLRLSRTGAPRVRQDATRWVIEVLTRFQPAERVRPAHLVELLDSPHLEVRQPACELVAREPRFASATELWAALAESPHDDARAFLLAHLEAHQADLEKDAVRRVWTQTLLSVHRGSHHKPRVAAQLAARIIARTDEAPALLPLLGLLLRSVRPPERRTALAELARAAVARPALAGMIATALPELTLHLPARAAATARTGA